MSNPKAISPIIPATRISAVETYYFATKLKEIAKLNAAGQNIINLGIGSPDLKPPQKALNALTAALQHPAAHKYQSYYGIPELRKAFAEFYAKHFKVKLNPDSEILPLMGSKEGIMHISMSHLDAGDEVLIPNPGYPSYRMATLLAGGTPIDYDLSEKNNWLPDLTELAKKDLTRVKIMWVNYPHMPTGQSGNKKLFEQLVAFGLEHNILICNDNPYAFILQSDPLSMLSVAGAKETAVELTSLSKCFNMAGWRVGAVLGNAHVLGNVIKFKSNMDSGMFRPVQEAAAVALRVEPSWFEGLNDIYKTRRVIARRIFDALSLRYDEQAGGLFLWGKIGGTNLNEHIESKALSEKILETSKVFITPGFIFGSRGEGYLRISLCSDEATLAAAEQRILSQKNQLI